MNHFNDGKPLLVVVDTSVLLHKLDQSVHMEHNDPQFESVLKANLVYLISGAWLGEHTDKLKHIVFVKDTKPYWRSEWLSDIVNTVNLPHKARSKAKTQELADLADRASDILSRGLDGRTDEETAILMEADEKLTIAYKAGRKLPAYRFKKIRKLIYGYLDTWGITCLGSPGFEADDMAASLVQTNSDNGRPWDILLLTVDTDWLGLVNPSVTWLCMTGYAPAVRDTLETCNKWAEKRLGVPLGTWRDIWDIKGVQGDKSDNLPPSGGKLLPVIDLLNPPTAYRYWELAPTRIAECFRPSAHNITAVEGDKARHHLKLNGMAPIINLLPVDNFVPCVF